MMDKLNKISARTFHWMWVIAHMGLFLLLGVLLERFLSSGVPLVVFITTLATINIMYTVFIGKLRPYALWVLEKK